MAERLLMIALSPTMTEGVVAKWKVEEGQSFSSGDVLCEVETDKASMDYEAPKSGVVLKIVVQQGGKAAVGDMIAVIGKSGEDPGPLLGSVTQKTQAQAAEAPPEEASKVSAERKPKAPAAPERKEAFPPAQANAVQADVATPRSAPSAPSGLPRSSPLARKIALELGVDIRFVKGSGPEGRVTERDVRAFAKQEPEQRGSVAASGLEAEAREAEYLPVSPMRGAIARRLSESFFSAPHFYLKREVSAEALVAARSRVNSKGEGKISLNAMLIKLSAAALAKHPEVNSRWLGDRIERRKAVDVALAVALPEGLIAPAVRSCDQKGVRRIDEELTKLIEKAKARQLAQEDYDRAGFTITNLGSFGVDEFTAIINPPGSAILAVGAIARKPVVNAEGEIVAELRMTLTLGCDHRSIDGAVGATFLADLAAMIEDPFEALL